MKLFAFTLLPVFGLAADFARVCQYTNQFAPPLSDCQGFESALNSKFPSGFIKRNDTSTGCEIVYNNGLCNLDICAFPQQGVDVKTFATGVNDILANCQAGGATGGYNILKGTNVTIGVVGQRTPYSIRCHSDWSAAPSTGDCQIALAKIGGQRYVNQSSDLGCSIVASQGSCRLSYCDNKGARMSISEFTKYTNSILSTCPVGSSTAGWVQVTDDIRVGIWRADQPTSVTNSNAVCRSYPDVNGPSQSNMAQAISDVVSTYSGKNIVQKQFNNYCFKLYVKGDLQVDLCGPPGAVISTDQYKAAMNSIGNTCLRSGLVGGYIRVPSTACTLSISTSQIAKNIWCNTAPNNSPTLSDCRGLIAKFNDTKTYFRIGPNQGCTQLVINGKCRMNVCAPPGTAISGRMLHDAFGQIGLKCVSNFGNQAYMSGIWQYSKDVSISIYDPPGTYGLHNPGDIQTASGTPNGGTVCFNYCDVYITYDDNDTAIPGCGDNFVNAEFGGACNAQPQTLSQDRSVTVNLEGCQGDNDGLRMRWYIDPDSGQEILALLDYGADVNDDQYTAYSYAVSDCQAASTIGGDQCVAQGGGCALTPI